ncbi:tropinone reductase like protein [Quercus suber]|uniref:Tropinone reductase like protein n=1 Tax=Quercus suber TaxID=58331 RepID=A0AAW0J2X9_QUESU
MPFVMTQQTTLEAKIGEPLEFEGDLCFAPIQVDNVTSSAKRLLPKSFPTSSDKFSKGRPQTWTQKGEWDWEGKGFVVTGSVCDVSSKAQRERLMETTVSSIFNGKLNILVSCPSTHPCSLIWRHCSSLINNAGTNIRKPTVEYSAEEYYIRNKL